MLVQNNSGFPTPTSLQAAQRRYSKNKKTPKKNDGEVPEPFPPPTLKAEIYNVADYADVDSHARKVSFVPHLLFPSSLYSGKLADTCYLLTIFTTGV